MDDKQRGIITSGDSDTITVGEIETVLDQAGMTVVEAKTIEKYMLSSMHYMDFEDFKVTKPNQDIVSQLRAFDKKGKRRKFK